MKRIVDGNKIYYIIEEGKFVRFCVINEVDSYNYNLTDEELQYIRDKENLNKEDLYQGKVIWNLNSKSKYLMLPVAYLREYVKDEDMRIELLKNKINIFQLYKEDGNKWIVKHIDFDLELRILNNMLKDNKVLEYNKLRKEALEKGLIDSKTKVNLKELKELLKMGDL